MTKAQRPSAFPRILLTLILCGAVFYAVYQQVGDGALSVVRGKGEDRVVYELLNPRRLLLLSLTPLIGLIATFSLADLPPIQKWLGVLLRVGLLSALIVALARPAQTTDATKVSTVFLVDVSESVTPKAIEQAQERVLAAYRAREDNDVQLITFAERAHSKPLTGEKGVDLEPEEYVKWMRNTGEDAEDEGKGSNLQAALQLAYGLFPPGHLRRAVLISDGGQTSGDLLAEATRAKSFGVTLHYDPYTEAAPKDGNTIMIRYPELPDC